MDPKSIQMDGVYWKSNETLPGLDPLENETYKFSDFKGINLEKDQNILTEYLNNELIKLKLIYIRNKLGEPKKPVLNIPKQRRRRGQRT